MQDQLISFETAKLAKEKGFAVGTRINYTIYHKTQKSNNPSFRMTKGEIELSADYMINNGPGDFTSETYSNYEAPTQSLLQKWLREKHKLQIEIALYHCHGKWLGPRYQYLLYKICETELEWENLNGEATQQYPMESALQKENANMSYEEALELALQEALKLIP